VQCGFKPEALNAASLPHHCHTMVGNSKNTKLTSFGKHISPIA